MQGLLSATRRRISRRGSGSSSPRIPTRAAAWPPSRTWSTCSRRPNPPWCPSSGASPSARPGSYRRKRWRRPRPAPGSRHHRRRRRRFHPRTCRRLQGRTRPCLLRRRPRHRRRQGHSRPRILGRIGALPLRLRHHRRHRRHPAPSRPLPQPERATEAAGETFLTPGWSRRTTTPVK